VPRKFLSAEPTIKREQKNCGLLVLYKSFLVRVLASDVFDVDTPRDWQTMITHSMTFFNQNQKLQISVTFSL
jgi:hypothetical protein